MEREFMLSIKELKQKYPMDSIHEINGRKYIVKGYKEPMASNCMVSFPRIIFEEYIDLTIHNTDILESTTLKKYYDRK